MCRRVLLPFLLLGATAEVGCVTRLLGIGGEPRVEGSKGSVPLAKVERYIDTLAERHVTLIADACDVIERESPASDERRRAHHLKLANGSAVYDIVTQPDPLGRLADLYVLIELEYMVWVQEGWAESQFGERGKNRLAPAVLESRREMIHLANLAMKPDRQAAFDNLIRSWRHRNPDVKFITGIRFGALPEMAGKTILESASSFFEVINPIEDTAQSVERSRILADRAFFFSKRFLKLADWQIEAAFDNTFAKPEVREILSGTERLIGTVEHISRTIRELPDQVAKEREELLSAWDIRKDDVVGPVREIHSAIMDGQELARLAKESGQAFEGAFRELHQLVGSPSPRDSRAPPAPAFDIRDVTTAAGKIKELAQEGPGVVQNLEELSDHLLLRAIELAAAILALILLYRAILVRWIKAGAPRAPSAKDRRPPTSFDTRHGSPT